MWPTRLKRQLQELAYTAVIPQLFVAKGKMESGWRSELAHGITCDPKVHVLNGVPVCKVGEKGEIVQSCYFI